MMASRSGNGIALILASETAGAGGAGCGAGTSDVAGAAGLAGRGGFGVAVGGVASSQEVVIEIEKHSDGTLLVLPARAA